MSALAAATGSRQYATFLVGGHYLGIEVLDVQEVLREQHITPVPLAPEVFAGLINLRGQIVPEIDMRRLLRLPPREANASRFSVVVRTEQGTVSLLMDEIDDVLELGASSFEASPRNVEAHVKELLIGVHKLRGRLLLILDTQGAVSAGAR